MDQEYGLNAISWEDKGFEDRTVDRLMVAFTENLNIDDMLLCKCLSEQLISDDDVSRIGATLKAGRRCEAVRDLLLRIKRNPPNYLETFCGVLGYSKSNFFLESRVKEEYSKQLGAKKKSRPGILKGSSTLVGDGSWPFDKTQPEDNTDRPMSTARECWEKRDQNAKKICSFKSTSIKDNYTELIDALPIDNLLSVLFSKTVITSREKANIQEKSLREDKVSYLFDHIILPALKIGHDVKYNNLIKVMSSNEDTTANYLAKILTQGVERQKAEAMHQ